MIILINSWWKTTWTWSLTNSTARWTKCILDSSATSVYLIMKYATLISRNIILSSLVKLTFTAFTLKLVLTAYVRAW